MMAQEQGKAVPFKNACDYVPTPTGVPHNKQHAKNYTPVTTPTKK
jgi:hypothetical protein